MKILHSIALCGAVLAAFAASAQRRDHVRFGVIADIQYCDCDERIGRYFRNSPAKLAAAVEELNTLEVRFTVNLGDLVDADPAKNLGPILDILRGLDRKCYNTTGNHDYGEMDNAALYDRLGMPAPYYSFRHKGWRFVMLNTNEVAPYSHIAGTPLQGELEQMMETSRRERRRNGASYNGGVGRRQLEWLREELAAAQDRNDKVVVLSHHPLYAAAGFTALDDREVLEVLSSHQCVKAAISGHHHAGDFGLYEGIPFITMQGMVETENRNAWATVDLYSDRLVFTGHGRAESYEIELR